MHDLLFVIALGFGLYMLDSYMNSEISLGPDHVSAINPDLDNKKRKSERGNSISLDSRQTVVPQ